MDTRDTKRKPGTRRQPRRADQELLDWLVKEAVDVVQSLYARWRIRGGQEPALTAASVMRCVDVEDAPGKVRTIGAAGPYSSLHFSSLPQKEQVARVQRALESARKAGKLHSSYGLDKHGKETRLYEPME